MPAACKTLPAKAAEGSVAFTVEGVPNTAAVVLLHCERAPKAIRLGEDVLSNLTYSATEKLLWVRFTNSATPRALSIEF